MLSPRERAVWTTLAVVLVAAAVAAWWTAERWTPLAGPWARQTWLAITRPSPPPGHPRAAAAAQAPGSSASAPAALPRKCVQGNRTVYTDQPCPPGSKEQKMDAALNVLPQ